MAADQNDGSGDNLLGRTIHSFIIKIWREEGAKERRTNWRGHITHVPSNERRYFTSLGDIGDFIKTYLQRMGICLDLCWRVKQWLRKRKSV